MSSRASAVWLPGLLVVGDAAGFYDPFTGEGISYAIWSGQLAAASLLDSGFDVSVAGARYQSTIETSILRELRAGRFLAICARDFVAEFSVLFLVVQGIAPIYFLSRVHSLCSLLISGGRPQHAAFRL